MGLGFALSFPPLVHYFIFPSNAWLLFQEYVLTWHALRPRNMFLSLLFFFFPPFFLFFDFTWTSFSTTLGASFPLCFRIISFSSLPHKGSTAWKVAWDGISLISYSAYIWECCVNVCLSLALKNICSLISYISLFAYNQLH